MFCFYDKDHKVGYYPVHKCGSTTFNNLFTKMGWETTENMEDLGVEYSFFSLIRDPIERHYSGMSEYIKMHNLDFCLDDKRLQPLLTNALLDIHSYPITWPLGSFVERIYWIPMHSSVDTNEEVKLFLSKHGVHIDNIENKHIADDRTKNLVKRLKYLHDSTPNAHSLTQLYEHDMKLWFKAVDEFVHRGSKWSITN